MLVDEPPILLQHLDREHGVVAAGGILVVGSVDLAVSALTDELHLLELLRLAVFDVPGNQFTVLSSNDDHWGALYIVRRRELKLPRSNDILDCIVQIRGVSWGRDECQNCE